MELREKFVRTSASFALAISSIGGVVARDGMHVEAGASTVNVMPGAYIKEELGVAGLVEIDGLDFWPDFSQRLGSVATHHLNGRRPRDSNRVR